MKLGIVGLPNVGKSTLAMSSTASLGILLSTGLSAIFTAINQYKLIFLVCAILMSAVAVVWLVSFKFLYEKRKEEKQAYSTTKTKEYICGCGCHFEVIFEAKKTNILVEEN